MVSILNIRRLHAATSTCQAKSARRSHYVCAHTGDGVCVCLRVGVDDTVVAAAVGWPSSCAHVHTRPCAQVGSGRRVCLTVCVYTHGGVGVGVGVGVGAQVMTSGGAHAVV